MPNAPSLNSYAQLLSRLNAQIESGRSQIEHAKALTYWKVGELVSSHILKNQSRASYGDGLYPRLSKDLNIDERTLQQAVKFYREMPIPNGRTELTWTHYRALIGVEDMARRGRLLKRIRQKKLNSTQLEREIHAQAKIIKKEDAKLVARKGVLYTYQIDRVEAGEVFIDLGFNITHRATGYEVRGTGAAGEKLKAGDIIISSKSNRKVKRTPYHLERTTNTPKDIYTYRASVIRVIDGDTMWVNIDVGFNIFVRQKLRLRSVDAPEADTSAGQKAKAFVQKLLKGLDYILIKTSTSDKYDRYLADVFLPSRQSNNTGATEAPRPKGSGVTTENEIFLNQQLLDEGWAQVWRE